jgi:hypothetical protein
MKNEELTPKRLSSTSGTRPHARNFSFFIPNSSLISPAAAFLITDILAQRTRPDLPMGYQNSRHLPKIA